ncbi:unnamed protein product, partial [Vitis vinifera]|uniref:Uncharacterized protein n=1 Tax=Vitis vinifera TaxID=29760 RepID=E0CSU6_VITVI
MLHNQKVLVGWMNKLAIYCPSLNSPEILIQSPPFLLQ